MLLAACVSTAPVATQQETPEYASRKAELLQLNDWSVSGRIGFKIGDEGGTGAMSWAQQGREMQFSFHGPLGSAAFKLDGSPPNLLLQTADGEVQRLQDPDTELQARFGWSAPFASLRYWMIGVADPGNDAQTAVDEAGRLRTLNQAGWSVAYDRYHDMSPAMPKKLTLTRQDVRIRVIIDYWQLN